MLFNSLAYLLFLPTVVLIYWLSPHRLRLLVLLVASYGFYMSWNYRYGLLILGLTVANYLIGLALEKFRQHGKQLLSLAVTVNLLALAFFKYAYFTRDLASWAMAPLGTRLPEIPFLIILPLGISFFVFEFIHYVTDVYRGNAAVRSLPAFALFAAFFPTQIAGPIKRFQDFVPQLDVVKRFKAEYFDEGLSLILFGLFKKVLFADNLAVVVQSCFDHPQLLSAADLWLATYAFAFQIYFDFSGYTDIARGSALLLGFKVPINFNLPYLATSVADFWHRWHISLSTWLRDYLFVPLGGSRCPRWLNYRNLVLTMALGGLWHGAAMHFFAWGVYHGALLVAHREFRRWSERLSWLGGMTATTWFHVLSILLTFHAVCIGWVFFRASTVAGAVGMLKRMLFLEPAGALKETLALTLPSTEDPVIFMVLPLLLALLFSGQLLCGWLAARDKHPVLPGAVRAAWVAAVIGLLLVFSPDTSPKFYYFQF